MEWKSTNNDLAGEPLTLADADLEGTILRDYHIEQCIGKGRIAWLYKAFNRKLRKMFAIKILFSQWSNDKVFCNRFLQKMRIQAQLKHNNIIELFEIIGEQGLVGIVMNWVNGRDLKYYLEQHRVPMKPSKLLQFFLPLVDAMTYAHQMGVIHRDLKPGNVLLQKQHDQIIPQIVDFGIVEIMQQAGITPVSAIMETPQFMSPEQCHSASQIDARTDIYSLGVILYLMATGRLPFVGTQRELPAKILYQAPPPIHETHPAIRDVILRCLSKEPDERFDSCDDLAAAMHLALLQADPAIQIISQSSISLAPPEYAKTMPTSATTSAKATPPPPPTPVAKATPPPSPTLPPTSPPTPSPTPVAKAIPSPVPIPPTPAAKATPTPMLFTQTTAASIQIDVLQQPKFTTSFEDVDTLVSPHPELAEFAQYSNLSQPSSDDPTMDSQSGSPKRRVANEGANNSFAVALLALSLGLILIALWILML